jgi:hypothetical protein
MFPKPNPKATQPVSCGDADSIPVSSPHAVRIPQCITQRCFCSVPRKSIMHLSLPTSTYMDLPLSVTLLNVNCMQDWGGGVAVAPQAGKSRVRFPMVSLEIFTDNPSGRTMALGSTQPLTEISARNISWERGKGRRCVGLTNLPLSYADCLEIWGPQPPENLRACPDLYRDCITFTTYRMRITLCWVITHRIVVNS